MQVGGPTGIVPSQEEKQQGLLVWVLGIFIGFISPLIFMIVAKEKPFVYRNAMQCLTFQIVMAIAWVASFVLSFVIIGFFLMPVLWVLGLVVMIMGAMAANRGEVYEPPVTANLARQWFKV